MPWAYQRFKLAQLWGGRPDLVVDTAPRAEINEAWAILNLEASCQPPQKPRPD